MNGVGAAAVAVLLSVAGCGGDDPKGDATPTPKTSAPGATGSPGKPLASVPMAHAAGPGRIDLLALNRTSDKAVTGQFRIVNEGKTALKPTISFFEAETSYLGSLEFSGVGLLDGRGNKLYMPLRTSDRKCLCSPLTGKLINPGASLDVFAVFPSPPADVKRVTVTVPLTVPFQDVPIADAPGTPPPGQTIDPASAALAAPRILAVNSVAEGDEQSVDEKGDDRAVRLSADVLFALNKADLTPRAEELLKDVAKQIDASTGTTIKVDGYTDSSGNDAINQPLSERRAKAVADRLKTLVTRQGVTFQPVGHGSKDPTASNATEEGRRKNRRVTVTFPRPAPPPPPAAPPGAPFTLGGTPAVIGTGTIPAAPGLKIEINSLHRDPAGVTELVWTVRNTGTASVSVERAFLAQAGINDTGGVVLFDPTKKLAYKPLNVGTANCLCSGMLRADARKAIAPGESIVFGGLYKPMPEATTVDVRIPWQQQAGTTITGLPIK
ncbi:OmpA family protein [Spirillospora sp. NPDC047279]|uniref:OmpA family protein n=1 Tax=Spirillospora sp. NPDC047279 TaxID=3155478 RepID=UPI0033F12D76